MSPLLCPPAGATSQGTGEFGLSGLLTALHRHSCDVGIALFAIAFLACWLQHQHLKANTFGCLVVAAGRPSAPTQLQRAAAAVLPTAQEAALQAAATAAAMEAAAAVAMEAAAMAAAMAVATEAAAVVAPREHASRCGRRQVQGASPLHGR